MNNEKIEVRVVATKLDLAQFLRGLSGTSNLLRPSNVQRFGFLPWDVKAFLGKTDPFSKTSNVASFVATDKGEVVAQCSFFLNRHRTHYNGEPVGFFGFFSCLEGVPSRVLGALFEAGFAFLRQHRAKRILGPIHGLEFFGYGLWSGGAKDFSLFPFSFTPDFFQEKLVEIGFVPFVSEGVYCVEAESPEFIDNMKKCLGAEVPNGVHFRSLDLRNFQRELAAFYMIYQRNFSDKWYHTPISFDEFYKVFGSVKFLLPPKFLQIAEYKGEPQGFALGLPNYSASVDLAQKNFLLGKISFALQRLVPICGDSSATFSVLMVNKEFQRKNIAAVLGSRLFQAMLEEGVKKLFFGTVEEQEGNRRSWLFPKTRVGEYRGYQRGLIT